MTTLRFAWWRFRSTFDRRWGGYLAIVLLVGLLGGLSMGSVAGARRTQSTYPVYLASTNPTDIQYFTEYGAITNVGYSPSIDRAIARLPYVKNTIVILGFDGVLAPLAQYSTNKVPGEAPPAFEGSLNGEYSTQDRVTVLSGRLFNPNSQADFIMSANAAAAYGLHVGSRFPMGFYTLAEAHSPSFRGYPADKPNVSIDLKLTGLVESSNQIVEDDDAVLGSQFAVLSPALTRRLSKCCVAYTYVSLRVNDLAKNTGALTSAVKKIVPKSLTFLTGGQTDDATVAEAERVIRPESIAFGIFGLIAGLAALLICGQVIARAVRRNSDDGGTLRALGAGPIMTTFDGLVGIVGAVVLGSVLAVLVAAGLSPLAPIGPVRPVYPDLGINFDWTVLGLGFVFLVVILSVVALFMAYRVSSYRSVSRQETSAPSGTNLVRMTASLGLPLAAVTGIRSAFGGRSARDAAPMRSALIGVVLAVVVVVGSFTFGASLNSLVSHPSLYGWNWNYALLSGFSGAEDLPAAETTTLLSHDPDVAHFAGVYFADATINGEEVPVLASSPNARVNPPLLSGHNVQSPHQVVLGPATLAALHMHLGDTVVVNTRSGARTVHLRIVGTATLPISSRW